MLDMIDRLIAREGGEKITRDPDDPGGVTKYGISKKSHPDLDIENLTYTQAKDIYIQEYYVGNNLQLLPVELQENVLDFVVHSGAVPAIVRLQRVAGAKADGKIGPITVAAIKKYLVTDIISAYKLLRILYLIEQVKIIPKKIKYLSGWTTRVWNL